MKVFDDAGVFSHWAINLHVAPLPDEELALTWAEKLMSKTKRVLNLKDAFPPLQRAQ
jgi:hypothetical protein